MNKLLAYTGVLGGCVEERPPQSGVYVRIEPKVYNSVVFLGDPNTQDENQIEPKGTGFLFRYGEPAETYLVTAAHVAQQFDTGPLAVRMAGRKAHRVYVETLESIEAWYTHPNDDTVDIAVTPFEVPAFAANDPLTSGSVLTQDIRVSRNIGAGDPAYVTGLFNWVHGPKSKRHLPFVYTGNIASMVDGDRIPWVHWTDNQRKIEIEGHVICVHTIKGASGSPVFVRATMMDEKTSPFTLGTGKSTWLLGVWKGMYKADADKSPMAPALGVTIPATKILEIMEHPELKKRRKNLERKQTAELADAIEDASLDSPRRKGDELLKRMLNTPPKPRA